MEQNELQDGITVFHSVEAEIGVLHSVYLGPGGVFIHAEAFASPDKEIVLLKNLLRVSRLQLYADRQGLYDPCTCRFGAHIPKNEIEKHAVAFTGFRGSLYFYTPEDISAMCRRLTRADAYAKGWYRSPSGSLFLRHGNVFREASDKDPELMYYLNLFGGVLGLHRFYLGKFFLRPALLFDRRPFAYGMGNRPAVSVARYATGQAKPHSAIAEAPSAKMAAAPGWLYGFLCVSGSFLMALPQYSHQQHPDFPADPTVIF